jgi:hypothetical protein
VALLYAPIQNRGSMGIKNHPFGGDKIRLSDFAIKNFICFLSKYAPVKVFSDGSQNRFKFFI